MSNFENTRWFLVLRLNRPANNGLNQLLRLSNSSLACFGQLPLYESPAGTQKRKHGRQTGGHQRNSTSPAGSIDADYTSCFHISIAWTLEEPSHGEKERLTSIEIPARELIIKFNNVKVKVGNQIYSEALLTSIKDEAGLEGVWGGENLTQHASSPSEIWNYRELQGMDLPWNQHTAGSCNFLVFINVWLPQWSPWVVQPHAPQVSE